MESTENQNGGNEETLNDSAEASPTEKLKAELEEAGKKYLYLYADFENYKKRVTKERSDLVKFGWEGVARELLQIQDNFERALSLLPENTDAAFRDGLKLISQEFRGTMERKGVKAQVTVGQTFDPNLHEAVGQEASDKPQGTILREIQKGYMLYDRLLRPARVILSQ